MIELKILKKMRRLPALYDLSSLRYNRCQKGQNITFLLVSVEKPFLGFFFEWLYLGEERS